MFDVEYKIVDLRLRTCLLIPRSRESEKQYCARSKAYSYDVVTL